MNEACTKIINFVTPLGGVTVLLCKGVTLWGIIRRNLIMLLYSLPSSRQTKCIMILEIYGSTNVGKIHDLLGQGSLFRNDICRCNGLLFWGSFPSPFRN